MLTVMGMDPGLAATGLGVVAGQGTDIARYSFGALKTSRDLPLAERLRRLHEKATGVIKAQNPALIVIEAVFFLEKYPTSGIVLGKVSGVLMLAACEQGVPVVEVPVREAKQVLTGNGQASKAQLERAVRHTLGAAVPIRPDHASDALGLALIGLLRYADKAAILPTDRNE